MKRVAGELKLLYSQYRELRAFARFGSDLDEDTKARLALGERIVEVLKQKRNAPVRVGCQVAVIYAVTHGYLDGVALEDVAQYERELYEYMQSKHGALLDRFEHGCFEDEDVRALVAALDAFWR
jgi:F-type H+-transporting ATPase subunit alpha